MITQPDHFNLFHPTANLVGAIKHLVNAWLPNDSLLSGHVLSDLPLLLLLRLHSFVS